MCLEVGASFCLKPQLGSSEERLDVALSCGSLDFFAACHECSFKFLSRDIEKVKRNREH